MKLFSRLMKPKPAKSAPLLERQETMSGQPIELHHVNAEVDALLAERERDKALLKDIHENFIPVEWTPKYYELSARIVAALEPNRDS